MKGREYMHMGKKECEEAGKVWVEAHMRSMTYVHGYCRDRTKEEIESMSPSERREFEKKSPNLEGHYEKSGRDPLDAISEILLDMDLPYNGEIEYELPDGKDTTHEDDVEKAGSAGFAIIIYKNGRYYNFSGTVLKESGRWTAEGKAEEVEF